MIINRINGSRVFQNTLYSSRSVRIGQQESKFFRLFAWKVYYHRSEYPSFYLHVVGPPPRFDINNWQSRIHNHFCGWQGSTLGGGAFFVGKVINYYARQSGGRKAREAGKRGSGARMFQEGRTTNRPNREEKWMGASSTVPRSELGENKHWAHFAQWLCSSTNCLRYYEKSNFLRVGVCAFVCL